MTPTDALFIAAAAAACLPLAADHRLEAPADRQDTAVYFSAPSALHLKAHTPGDGYFRFPEKPVAGGQRYRLRFAYLRARGGADTAAVRVCYYEDTARAWKALGATETPLPVVGRWARVDLPVVPPPAANSVAVDFRVTSDCDCGECWIDDCSLAPRGQPITRGP